MSLFAFFSAVSIFQVCGEKTVFQVDRLILDLERVPMSLFAFFSAVSIFQAQCFWTVFQGGLRT